MKYNRPINNGGTSNNSIGSSNNWKKLVNHVTSHELERTCKTVEKNSEPIAFKMA